MTATGVQTSPSLIFLSEIFPITISNSNFVCFQLNPKVGREDGNRLSFHLSYNLKRMVVIWHDGYFYTLGLPNMPMPPLEEWQDILEDVREKLKDFENRYYLIELVDQFQVTPAILSQLAFQVLRKTQFKSPDAIPPTNKVAVKRELDFWAETIELQSELKPAVSLTVHSSILYQENLEHFYQNNPHKNLIDLKVRDIELRSYGTITQLPGTVGQHRDKLIKQANRDSTKQALRDAPDGQPLVTVEFKNREQRHYPMVLLRPCVSPETADRFEVDYGKLLKATKIAHKDRIDLLNSYKKTAKNALSAYGFQLSDMIDSYHYHSLFWQPSVPFKETPLLFGKQVKGFRDQILKGLSKGGVYRHHKNYQAPSTVIRIAALKICDLSLNRFLEALRTNLKRYGFNSEIVTKRPVQVSTLAGADIRAQIDKAVDELIAIPHDIVLTFLPQSDRNTDEDDGGSLYHRIYSRLLRRQMASQVIYADTLSTVEHRQILNQVVPGILAKLGNLPFVLADEIEIADYFVGLDISRESKQRLPGTKNACASIRLYGKQGEFIRYQLEDALIDGEEIPQKFLETLLREAELREKTVLIYRDGLFRGKEVENLLEWGRAIGSKFILVECSKSYIPRLYNLSQGVVLAPDKGLALRLSSREAILITTKVSPNVGLARPLRLKVNEAGHQASIESILDTTLKLTLLHHGALQTPRLPMPLYGSDRMAYLRLKGIYPTNLLEGDHQFWL
ncbi:MAG TPA: stem cell self-renewal protein Piwi [Cyanobacteria bacterium UBA12227]|nr:stem cell self-renewal protein Piwi [Cyanobacteria bacterium UBA12227]HAX87878.1 stem cell self-renewal protein Piwi [Cyanobacteria bacterium UBA11370]HBY79662.1 stem cell self-renewal protein Piwi [Cyanobacteria bacterium UBA11148]